jgi:hypothetical protein
MVRLLGKSFLSTLVHLRNWANKYFVYSPGRFHASIVMKLVIAHIVMGYDLKLEDEKERTLWSWETFTMPYESTRFVLKERKS